MWLGKGDVSGWGLRGWGACMAGGRACMAGATHTTPVNRLTRVKTLPSTASFVNGRYIFTEETCSTVENQQVTLGVRVSAPCKTDVNVDPGPADVF